MNKLLTAIENSRTVRILGGTDTDPDAPFNLADHSIFVLSLGLLFGAAVLVNTWYPGVWGFLAPFWATVAPWLFIGGIYLGLALGALAALWVVVRVIRSAWRA